MYWEGVQRLQQIWLLQIKIWRLKAGSGILSGLLYHTSGGSINPGGNSHCQSWKIRHENTQRWLYSGRHGLVREGTFMIQVGSFVPAETAEHGPEHFSLQIDTTSTDTFHIPISGELKCAMKTPAVYVFAGPYCYNLLITRFISTAAEPADRLPVATESPPTRFEGWLNSFGLPPESTLDFYYGPPALFRVGENNLDNGRLSQCAYLGSLPVRRTPTDATPGPLAPLWLTCLGRCGSSLMMRYLSLHPGIHVSGLHPFELNVARHFFKVCMKQSMSCPDRVHRDPGKDAVELLNPWYDYTRIGFMQEPRLETFFGRDQILRNIDFCRESVSGYFSQFENHEMKRYFCEKDGTGIASIDRYREVWPDSRRIFLVRDFRDNCASVLSFCERKGTKGFGLQHFDSAEEWIRSIGEKSRLIAQRKRLGDDRDIFVSYEGMLQEPVVELSRLFDTLELNSDKALIETILNKSNKMDKKEAVTRHQTSKNSAQSIGRWRDFFEGEQRKLVVSTFAEASAAFGYPEH
jgi:hypothetical protein